MRKSVKRWCIAAVILMLLGAAMIIFALKLGASTLVVWTDGEFKISQETTTLEKSLVEEFHNINIDLQSSNIEFVPSDDYYVEFKECAGILQYEVEDDTLVIKQKEESIFMNFGFGYANDRENTVKIYYPEDATFENITMEVDMGSLYVEEINASILDVSCDMGSVEFEKCFAEEIHIDVDMGNIVMEEAVTGEIKVETDKGNVEIHSIDLTDAGTVNCNMGNVEMSFEKPVETYEIYAKIDMGELSINGEDYGSTHKSEGEIPLEVTNDMGNIELNFAK